jgi:membrane-bound inhibitor of C-type lysozyme
MPKFAKSLLVLSPFALLAACGGESETADPMDDVATTPAATPAETAGAAAATATPVSYDCLPAQDLSVSYDNSVDPPTATLTLDGETYQLTAVEAASGAKYATDAGRSSGRTLVWWTQGQDGTLYEGTVGGTEADEEEVASCSQSSATAG